MTRLLIAATAVATLFGCTEKRTEFRVLHRSACEVCHRPLNQEQRPEGIADAHPWAEVSCVECHGGNAFVCSTGIVIYTDAGPQCDGEWVYDINESHVSGPDLRGLSSQQLDAIDPAYLRFVNPGDPRVASFGCGGAAQGGGCHSPAVERMLVSPMRHAVGILTPLRRRAGRENPVGAISTLASAAGDGECALTDLSRLRPEAIDPTSTDPAFAPTLANTVDHVLAKSCASCHLDGYGSGDAPGLHRSSGCSACHSAYDEDGLSKGTDPWVDKTSPSHPVTHTLTAVPPSSQCAICHHHTEAIGLSFRGFRRAGGEEPEGRVPLGRPLYGRPADGHISDESEANDIDETPPDVHFAAGMHCADCHTAGDSHGPSTAVASGSCAVTARCEDCHGTVRERAVEAPHLPRLAVDDSSVRLQLAIGSEWRNVPQLVDALDPDHPDYNALAASVMGPRADGRSHPDDVACQTCHAAWVPSQYGQFATLNLNEEQTSQTTGALTTGAVALASGPIATNDLVLALDTEGRLRPSVPSGRWFFTLKPPASAPETGFEQRPLQRTVEGSPQPVFGQRPVDPHTTVRRSGFAACNRCHSQTSAQAPDNALLLDLTFGEGTDRFVVQACRVDNDGPLSDPVDTSCGPSDQMSYRLDALRAPDGTSWVTYEWGSAVPVDSIERMRAIIVDESAPILIPVNPADRTDRAYPPSRPSP